MCATSQRRMDLWCNKTISYQNASHPECSGELRARFDRNEKSSRKMWRCYHESALTPDLSGYDDNLRSPCYYSRNSELKKVLKSCKRTDSLMTCLTLLVICQVCSEGPVILVRSSPFALPPRAVFKNQFS